jgi:LuxR family maltose regulon positive regulatory protein
LKDAEGWLEPVEPVQVQPATPSAEKIPESFDHAQDKLRRKMVVVDKQQWKSLAATIAIGHAYIAQALGNIPDTVRYARRALEFPEADPFRHSQGSMLLGMACWASGDLEAAGRVFADYTMKLRAAGNIPDAIGTTVVLADIRLGLGRLRQAICTTEQLLQFVMDQGEPISPDTADLHRELSELYLEQGNLEAAAQHLQKSRELGEKADLLVWRYRWSIAQARLNETQDDLGGALDLLNEAERLYIRTPLPDGRPIAAMKARIWLKQGKLAKALDWAGAQGLSPDDDLCYLREFEHITLARILIAQYQNERMDGTFQAATRLLDRLLRAAQEGGPRVGSVIEILVLQALAHRAQGNNTAALAPLARALTLAEPQGYLRIFVDEGEPMRLLIADFRFSIEKQMSSNALAQLGYTDKLLAAFAPLVNQPSTFKKPKSEMVEPLSERELEVLKLLRSELSGPEIARELMVSLSTVRTHTQNIFAKMGVNNRRAAVRRAEELNLF